MDNILQKDNFRLKKNYKETFSKDRGGFLFKTKIYIDVLYDTFDDFVLLGSLLKV